MSKDQENDVGLRMKRYQFCTLLLLALQPALSACGASNVEQTQTIDSRNEVASVEELYNHGVDALNSRRYNAASSEFNAVEQNYPYSAWAANAQIMSGYTQYIQSKYTDAISTLDRFIQLHPAHREIPYAYYLRALCYYEQISDIQRDQRGTEQAMNALREVVRRFPETSYSRDAQLKIDLCFDHLAGKEMEIGRYYQKQHLYTAAIGRFQRVVNDFQTTNHVPEALARLVEVYLALGLPAEATSAAAVLGYNYPGSSWYQNVFDQLGADKISAPSDRDGNTAKTQSSSNTLSRIWSRMF